MKKIEVYSQRNESKLYIILFICLFHLKNVHSNIVFLFSILDARTSHFLSLLYCIALVRALELAYLTLVNW